MIIERQEDVTPAVLKELERAPNARFKEVMGAFIRHMHDFVRDSKLTEEEFRTAMNYVVALGKASNESHNEAVLISGSLGISSLVCLLNNTDGQTDTDASLLGPFWREQSPVTPNGGSIVRSPTPGPALFVKAWFRDRAGNPIKGAEVDIWQSSTEGFYENQDPGQADMNLRGKFFTDENGHIAFQSIKPAGYPIPVSGPTGRTAARAGAPQHAPRASSLPGFKRRIQDTDLSDLCRGRQEHRQRCAVRRHAPLDRQFREARGSCARRERDEHLVLARP